MITMSTLLLSLLLAGAGPAPDDTPAAPPRLVVLVAIDQCIPEQMARLAPALEGGLERLWSEGSVFEGAEVPYANSDTGPGHATMGTGCLPRHHGISGNMIYVRDEGRYRYCVVDPDQDDVGQEGVAESPYSQSPRWLEVPALGDHLKARNPESRVVAVAGKDRSAILLGGRHPDLALWWDGRGGGFQTSTWYGQALPEFVRAWNTGWLDQASGWTWTSPDAELLAEVGAAADDREGEPRGYDTLPRTLPTATPGDPAAIAALAGRTLPSPLGDRFVVQMAQEACAALDLGQDEVPDLLALSLSACDLVGHAFGPYSVEVTDILLGADRELGDLFSWLDDHVGVDRWVVALTADHGVCELPEQLVVQGIPARRFTFAMQRAAEGALQEAATAFLDGDADLARQTVQLRVRDVLLDEAALAAAGREDDLPALRRALADALTGLDWVHGTFTREELEAGSEEELATLYRDSYALDRLPDVVLCPEPRVVFAGEAGTNHGTPWPYDRRVPLAFYGPGIPAAVRQEPAALIDIVPTLLDRLGLPVPPDVDGRVLPFPR